MRFASGWSTDGDSARAARDAIRSAVDRLGSTPELIFVHCTEHYDRESIERICSVAGRDVSVHAATTSGGVMTEEGFHAQNGRGLAVLALSDPSGSYGVGSAETGTSAFEAGRLALERALAQAARPGEMPVCLFLSAPSGEEERIIEGIESVIGSGAPIFGGSGGEDGLGRGAWQSSGDEGSANHVVVTALFPSVEPGLAYHDGYEPTGARGRVTAAVGRTLREIDERPAVEVYQEWSGGLLDEHVHVQDGMTELTALAPLGRPVAEVDGTEFYVLVHPRAVGPDGELLLYAELSPGDEIVYMRGTADGLVHRAGRACRAALEAGEGGEGGRVLGAYVVYCAACMHRVRDRMGEVVEVIRQSLEGTPFVGTFTFGEQGRDVGHRNRHGNLMIAAAVFSEDQE